MSKKHIVGVIVIAVILAGAGFFSGMKYGQAKTQNQKTGTTAFYRTGGGAGFARGAGQGGFAVGQILSKDNKSITVQSKNGSSKIVFYSNNTQVGKFVAGALTDLAQGQEVTVTGTPNSDGSMSAQNIEIMPAQGQQFQGSMGNRTNIPMMAVPANGQ